MQYGSAFFEADDAQDSDFDILMVAKNDDMQAFMNSKQASSNGHMESIYEASDMRSRFFFTDLYNQLA